MLPKMSKACLFLTICILYLTVPSFAQLLGELEVQEVSDEETIFYVVRSDEAILVVHSKIPNLSFDSNMGIISVDTPDPGEFRVHLNPGTNLITFKAEGYLPLKKMYHIEKRKYKEVRVFPKPIKAFTENRPEIILRYDLSSSGETVVGSLDLMVIPLNFKSGYVTLRPAPGKHTLKLNSGGRIWEKTFDLKEGESVEVEVNFPSRATEEFEEPEPGGLYITSNPSGAMVIMNQVQVGQTPFTQDDIPPGLYEVEIIKPLYLPEKITVDIKTLDYIQYNADLIPNFGKLTIKSNPSGASVFLNGELRGITPYDQPQTEAGSYTLRLVKQLFYAGEDRFEITPDGKISKDYDLKPQFGKVTIVSEPPGAVVFVDGQSWGKSPVTRDTIPSGTHFLKLQMEFHNDFEVNIAVADGEHLSRSYSMQPNFGLISVITDPPGADVQIEGPEKVRMLSPVNRMKLSRGTYKIRVEKELYEPFETEVILALGAEETFNPKLVRKTGNLKVSTEPQGAVVYLAGERKGKTPIVIRDVPTGSYEIRLDRDGYDILLDRVIIAHRRTDTFNKILSTEGTKEWKRRKGRALRWAFMLPGSGQFLSGQSIRGTLYSGVFVGSVAATVFSFRFHDDRKSVYENEQKLYRSSTTQADIDRHFAAMQNGIDKMETFEQYLFISLSAAAGVYLLQIVDAMFMGGGERPVIRAERNESGRQFIPMVAMNNNSLQIGFGVYF